MTTQTQIKAQTERLTLEEYLKTPEIKSRFDVVDGVIIMAAAPRLIHQIINGNMHLILRRFVDERELGIVLFAPTDVLIRRAPLRMRQPDLLFIRTGRYDMSDLFLEEAPDLVVEIISPSNTRHHVEEKLLDYAAIGVLECWRVLPEEETVEVLALVDGKWDRVGLYAPDDRLRSTVLEGLDVKVSQFFA